MPTRPAAPIVHETSHYLLDVAGARVPLWLNEGLANTFGSARSEGNAVWLQSYPQMVAWMQRHGSEVPTVQAMISAAPAEWACWDPTPMGSPHRGFGWALTAFLMSTEHGKTRWSTW